MQTNPYNFVEPENEDSMATPSRMLDDEHGGEDRAALPSLPPEYVCPLQTDIYLESAAPDLDDMLNDMLADMASF